MSVSREVDSLFASWPEPGVCCVWLPRLALRVEVLRHPDWEGRPLVLDGGPGERKVVQLCSPEAEQAGIRPGLPLREVLALCNDAIILQPHPVRVAAVLTKILGRLQRVSPAVEVKRDEIFLDLRGLARLYRGDLRILERAIRAAIPPLLHPRLGAARGKRTASVAARVAPASGVRVVPAHRTIAFLAPLPVSYLPLPPEMVQRLRRFGLRTIGDLAALPFAAVQAEFGPLGARAWHLAHGQDDEPIIPHRVVPTVRAALRFDSPLASSEAILAALRHLLARAFQQPALRGRAARQARLSALLVHETSWERVIPFKDPVADPASAYRVLKAKLQLPDALPVAPVEELALGLSGLGPAVARQQSFLALHTRPHPSIAEAARQLQVRYGSVPLYHVVEVEPWSRFPERRWMLVPCAL